MLPLLLALASVSGSPATAVEAPITAATVYSDRALVTRTAALSLTGRTRVAFPLLSGRATAASIRLEASGCEVENLTLAPVTEDDWPMAEARALLDALDKLDLQIDQTASEHAALVEIHDALAALTPATPDPNVHAPVSRLDPSGWPVAMAFLTGAGQGLQARLAANERQLGLLREKRAPLVEQARLLGAEHPLGGQRVVATVSGHGAARLSLSYEVQGARWFPSYDIQLAPAKSQVAIAFVGLVEQQTGEDWESARLTLSTAVPAQSSEFPKLPAWRIGTSERFEPTPVPEPAFVPPPPPASPRPPAARDERQRLRALLVARTEGGENLGLVGKGGGEMAVKRATQISDSAAMPPASPPVDERVARRQQAIDTLMALQRARSLEKKARVADEDAEETAVVRERAVAEYASAGRSARAPRPRVAVNIGPPPGYRYPRLDPKLPAALAAGHDLAFPSAARESVASGKGARRVALFSQIWPVAVERLVMPALAKEAFLIAEIKNPSRQALPGGHANLFVGSDPAGVADLKFVAPGEKFTLPLGIDQAIKPIRNVTQTTVETGLISKDEITVYTTIIELANPYPTAIAVRVKDQIPVTADKDRAEVRLVGSEPAAKLDAENGALEWRMTVAPGAGSKLKFVYSIKRPKGARLVQQ
jgi:hypothetical protein